MINKWSYLGIKLESDIYGCRVIPDDLELIRHEMLLAANHGNMEVVGEKFHKFYPRGVSGHLTLAESHMDVSIWPEYSYAEIDIRSCGGNAQPDRAMIHFITYFQPSDGKVERRYTGVFNREGTPSGLYLPPREYPRTEAYSLNDYIRFVENLRVGESRV